MESLDRMDEDTLKKPSELGVMISRQQEDAVMKGLSIFARDRFQNIRQLREALFLPFMEINLCMGCMQEKTQPGPCPHCGFDEAAYEPLPHHLPPENNPIWKISYWKGHG